MPWALSKKVDGIVKLSQRKEIHEAAQLVQCCAFYTAFEIHKVLAHGLLLEYRLNENEFVGFSLTYIQLISPQIPTNLTINLRDCS